MGLKAHDILTQSINNKNQRIFYSLLSHFKLEKVCTNLRKTELVLHHAYGQILIFQIVY